MRTPSLLGIAAAALAATPAFADLPPPDTYVETCTVAQQQTASSECLSCSAYYGDVDRCTKLLSPYCYTKVCKSWGASSWGETLCRSKSSDAPAVPSQILSILSSATASAPAGTAADGGMPKTCAPYQTTATKTVTGTQTASGTLTATATQSSTGSKTSSSTQSTTASQTATMSPTATATQSATSAPTATATGTLTATQSPTATASQTATTSPTATATQTATTEPTATATATTTTTATATTTTVSESDTQSNTRTQTTIDSPTGTGATTGTASTTAQDNSGCSVAAGTTAVRALGPLTLFLAGLLLVVLRRRSRR